MPSSIDAVVNERDIRGEETENRVAGSSSHLWIRTKMVYKTVISAEINHNCMADLQQSSCYDHVLAGS